MASDFDRALQAFNGLRADMQALIHAVAGVAGTITTKLDAIAIKEDSMAGELATLTQEVAETKTAIGSAITLIQGLKQRLDDAIASGDPSALTALSKSLDDDQKALAAAILANTPQGGGGSAAPIALPDGQVGVAYSGALPAIPGTAPFSHSVTGGALPDGLTLDSSSGALLGTPGTAGSFAFSATSTDSDPGTADVVRDFTVNVTA